MMGQNCARIFFKWKPVKKKSEYKYYVKRS